MENFIVANFLNVVKNNYANFNGRARRKEFWYYVLAEMILHFGGLIFLLVIALINTKLIVLGYIIWLLLSLFLFIPRLALEVRRLHDVGKSGWHIFVSLIPLVGAIYLLYLFISEGDQGANKYGEDPKASEYKN